MEIGKKIADLRRAKKITQLSLSKLAGVDYNTLRKVETWKTKNPSAKFMKDITNALWITISSFVNEEKPNVKINWYLPLGDLTADQFEDLIFMLIEKDLNKYRDVQRYAGRWDKSRDVVAREIIQWKKSKNNILFQAKRHEKISITTLKKEIDNINLHFFSGNKNTMKINDIVFCISGKVTSKLRDDIEEYAVSLWLPRPSILWPYEIYWKCRIHKEVLDTFFQWDLKNIGDKIGQIQDVILESTEDNNKILDKSSKKINEMHTRLTTVTIEDDSSMSKARRLINEWNYNKAKDILLPIISNIKTAQDKERLKKIYNNLGVCYTNSTDKEDVNIWIEYFEKALDIDVDFTITKQNLIGVLINERISVKKAIKLSKELLDSDLDNKAFFWLYIFALCINENYLEAEVLIADIDNVTELIEVDENIAMAIPMMYQWLGKTWEAEKYINISLSFFPNSIILNNGKWNLLMEKILKWRLLSREYDIVPFIEDLTNIREAYNSFSKAYELAQKWNLWNNTLLNRIRYNRYQSWILLNKSSRGEIKLDFKSDEIDTSLLSENEKINKMISDFGVALEQEKKEWLSYEIYENINSELELEYNWIKDFANKFFYNGFPEKTLTILEPLYDEAKELLDSDYWLMLSVCYALIWDDNSAIRLMNEAKVLFKGNTDEMSKILRNFSAISFRHHDSTQADRMVQNTQELQELNPDEKILTPMKAIEENGELSNEVLTFLHSIRDDFQNKKETFLKSPLPVYTLQKLFWKSFPESIKIPRDNYDFDFIIPYNNFDKVFLDTQEKNYKNTEIFVLDYSVLLNLSRWWQLGLVKLFRKKVMVSEELFQQIQDDLLRFEDKALRDLWNFIRKWEVEIFPYFTSKKKTLFDKADDFFDLWLPQTISYTLENNATFVTDDLRLCNTINNKEINWRSITSFILYKKALELGYIDKKQYSSIIWVYADWFNYFLPFNGDDLLNIVSEDEALMRISKGNYAKFKKNPEIQISRRVYFLLNQVHTPGSEVNSFLVVCNDFMKKLINLGFTDETKVGWTIFLTNFFSDFITMEIYIKNPYSVNYPIDFIWRIWRLLFDSSSKEYVLKNKNDILSGIELDIIRGSISELFEKNT